MAVLTFDDIEDVNTKKGGVVTFDDVPDMENPIAAIGNSPLGTEIGKRGQEMAAIIKRVPNQNPSSSALQVVGQGAKTIGTPFAMAAGALIPDSVKEYVSDSAVGDVARDYGDMWNQFAQTNPEIAADIGAATNIATTLPLGKAATATITPKSAMIKKAGAGAESAVSRIPGIVGDTSSGGSAVPKIISNEASGSIKAPTKAAITQFERESAATSAYAAAGQNKDIFPNIGSEYTTIIEKVKAKPLPSGKLTMEDAALNRHLDDYSGLDGKALDINDINRIDKSLGQKITAAFNQNDKAMATKLMDVQDDFRDALSGTKAGDTLSDARALAANNFRADDLQEILLNAKNYDNSATFIKNQFRNIAQNPRRLNSYPKEAQLIIKKIAEGGIAGDLLGQLGSRLGAIIGGATGGVGGAAAGAATGLAGRGAKTALYARRAENALKANNEPIRPLVEKYNMQGAPYVPQPKFGGYLPAPTYSVNNAGQAATLAQRAALGNSPSLKNVIAMASPEQKAAFASAFDKLDSAQRAQVTKQLERAWAQNTISVADMVAQSKAAIDDLTQATGRSVSNTAMQDALMGAINPTMRDIMKMPPAEARKAFKSYKAANKK